MHKGFSLVELSIVLVILGLLTGGILAGQSLIRAAELRSVTSDFQRYAAALYTFRDKYMALPGDMANATQFWTSAGGTGGDATCVSAQTNSSNATCNGDGSGQITGITGYANAERFMAWKHFANAGLIEGSYTGKSIGAAGSYTTSAGVNVPASKINNTVYDIYYVLEAVSSSHYFAGSQFDTNAISIFGNRLRPEESWNMDTKLDDGSPVYGKLVVHKPSSLSANNCATSDADTATYNVSVNTLECIVAFLLR